MEEKNQSDLPLLNQKKERCIIEKNAEPCLICSTPTQKLHLQVNACYACAAFYRRSLEAHINYKCQNNNEKCDLTVKKEGKPLCRLCRYKKCVEIGMVININKKENEIKKNDEKQETEEEEKTIEKEKIETKDYLSEIMNLPNLSEEGDLIEMDKIFDKLKEIFNTCPNTEHTFVEDFNYTKEFTVVIEDFIKAFKPTVQLNPYGGTREAGVKRCFFINKQFFATAEMLSKYSPFSSLPLNDKISLFCHFWNLFRLFERIYQAILYFKNNDENDCRIQCSFDEYFEINNIKTIYHVSIPNPTFYSLMLPMFLKGKQMISIFKKVNPTFEEFAYICHVGLWSCHEILKISHSTQTLAEKITNKISEDLHKYYVDELRVASYSARQAQLFKLISLAHVVVRSKKQMIAGRKLFNFGQYTFPYCNFETNFFYYVDKHQI